MKTETPKKRGVLMPWMRKLKGRQLWGRKSNVAKREPDEEQITTSGNNPDNLIAKHKTSQEASADSLRSLIKRATTDVEQIVDSIKIKAQQEAKAEATRIIDQAKQEADEIRRGADVAAQKQVEKETKLAVKEETKRKTEETRKAKEAQKQVENEAKLATQESALEERIEEPVQLEKEATIPEPVEVTKENLPEQHFQEERPAEEKPVSAPLKMDSQTLYSDEVELAIAVPVDPVAVSKLYNHLQMTPEIKILYTRGSWDRGTTITVSLDRPIPLIGIISKIPGIEVVLESPQQDNSAKGASSSLLGANKKVVKRIDLTLKEV